MRTSNPPSYDKIFPIRTGATINVAANVTIPSHRGLFITTTAITTVTFTNIDGTTCDVYFPSGVSYVLPIQVKNYTSSSTTSIYIYGLL